MASPRPVRAITRASYGIDCILRCSGRVVRSDTADMRPPRTFCRGRRAARPVGLERAGGEVYTQVGHLSSHGACTVGAVMPVRDDAPPRCPLPMPTLARDHRSSGCGASIQCLSSFGSPLLLRSACRTGLTWACWSPSSSSTQRLAGEVVPLRPRGALLLPEPCAP